MLNHSLLCVGVIAVFTAIAGCVRDQTPRGEGEVNKRHVVLIGASVGKGWDLAGMPARTGLKGTTLESVVVYDFDKSGAVDDILLRPKRRFRPTRTYLKGFFQPAPLVPDTVILKECAAYFPGDLSAYEAMLQRWVMQMRGKKVRVVVATVVPVTREHAAGRPGRIDSIRQFNDWVRVFASREKLDLLDMEAALVEAGGERFLAREFTSGDGLHLNRTAYDLLDRHLEEVLGKPVVP